MKTIKEHSKEIPVVRDVDVAVVGAGVSGLFAALGAAKHGAKTILIDRFGQLGGNMGPGGFILSSLGPGGAKTHHVIDYPGICKEFVLKLEERLKLFPDLYVSELELEKGSLGVFEYPSYSSAISYLALKMCEELGVELMLSAYAGNPIMEDETVTGVFVETKSGRLAIRSKVLVDATGDASIAERAGAQVSHKSATPEEGKKISSWCGWTRSEFPHWNDGGIAVIIAGIDYERYESFLNQPTKLTEADIQFREELQYFHPGSDFQDSLVPILRKAWESGKYRAQERLDGNFYVMAHRKLIPLEYGLMQMVVEAGGEFDLGNWEHVSKLEADLRKYAFDTVEFYRGNIPGFERARVMWMSAYLGARAGVGIIGEYYLTFYDFLKGARFDDVLFRSYVARRQGKGSAEGCDIPYRILLPKHIEGMLVVGRGASFQRRGHDSPVRPRFSMMMLGEAGGISAALAVESNLTVKKIQIKKLQKILLKEGFFMGEPDRIKELGLN